MKKIMVPTDFSASSRTGIRFAIHWAAQQKIELIFVHVLHVLRATQWTDAYFAKYAEAEENTCRKKLAQFVGAVYSAMKVKPGRHSFLILQGISADNSILEYCNKQHSVDGICISTRGAGTIKKIFGTHTGNLITKSAVPVLAVPWNYRVSAVKRVLYATDFLDYPVELKKVMAFASPLKAAVDVLHFTRPGETVPAKNKLSPGTAKKYPHGFAVFIEKMDPALSLLQNLQQQIGLKKPSVVVMFTNQHRTFFQKLFLSSKAAEFSFQAKKPLLVFKKKD
jgi:nucleotide-binding universal stress UspA family protein